MSILSCAIVRRRGAAMLAALVLTLPVAAAHAAGTMNFGSRSLYVPDPMGFEAISKSVPRFMQLAQAYLPPSNRLVEAYVTADDEAALSLGKPIDLKRYFQLQTLKSLDGTAVSNEEFQSAAGEIESGLKQALGDAEKLGGDLAAQGNKAVKDMTTVDPKVSVSGTGYLGIYRREPWGQFFTIKSKVSAGAESTTLVASGGIVLVNYQLVFLYAYSQYKTEGDRQWVQGAVSEWADAVHEANPDDPRAAPKSSLHFDFKGILRMGMIGAVIGGLIGLIGFMIRKSRA